MLQKAILSLLMTQIYLTNLGKSACAGAFEGRQYHEAVCY